MPSRKPSKRKSQRNPKMPTRDEVWSQDVMPIPLVTRETMPIGHSYLTVLIDTYSLRILGINLDID